MKTMEYRLEAALIIAQNSKARVGFFCGNINSARVAFEYIKNHGGHLGIANRQSMSLKMHTGGELKIRAIDAGSKADHAGSQFTHAFILDEDVDYECLSFIRSRVRTTEKYFNYPSGLYLSYGAEVLLNY